MIGGGRNAALGTPGSPHRSLWERCEAVSTEEMGSLEQKTCSCPLHLSPTRRKTGRELGEHLGERRHKGLL